MSSSKKLELRGVVVVGLLLSALLGQHAAAGAFSTLRLPTDGTLPSCEIDGRAARLDNSRIIELKRTTKNQYHDRGYIQGVVTRIFLRKGDHAHFEIRIADGSDSDVIEIIFNRDFGNPAVREGDRVIACGDYITSYAKANGYDASPSKALLHWVHENSRGGPHPDGFVVVNDRDLYGFGQKANPVRIK
jgi:hypothetical protein